MSAAFLQDILRKQVGFNGVIISDDMQMGAITDNYKFDESIIMAINAGCDIIYFFNNSPIGYDKDIAYKVRDVIFDAVKEGKIKKERILESYARILNLKKQFEIIQPSMSELESKKFELVGESNALNFKEALDIARYVEKETGVRPALLLAILQEELSLEKFDMCYLTDFKTGEGVRAVSGEALQRVMSPNRDIPGFLSITEELGRDPKKTLITCPMSFGWGGAMGPADFIPSSWIKYRDKIEKITGKSADPWNINDAFLAAGLHLANDGAKERTKEGEWNAAMLYFSISINSDYSFYGDSVLAIADRIQVDINILEGK